MRGEFIRGDGLVIPNNVTIFGGQVILTAALRGILYTYQMGLCSGVFDPAMAEVTGEPATGTGYGRFTLNQDYPSWPVNDTLNGEGYIESKACLFAATGNYNKPITRAFIVVTVSEQPVALSTPLQDPLLITPATDAALRTFKYRLYLR